MSKKGKFKFLVITDHSKHNDQNSFYGIVNSLRVHENIVSVHAATRGDERNKNFFMGAKNAVLYALELLIDVSFISFPEESLHAKLTDLDYFDFIMLRIPRPIPDEFFDMLIDQFDDRRIINRPSGIKLTSNKAFLLELSEWCPPMKIIKTWGDLISFSQEFAVVLKPYYSYGGKGILRVMDGIVSGDREGAVPLEVFKQEFESNGMPYLGMKYLQNVLMGDKRIVVAGGEVLSASLRLPPPSGWLCNIAMGGTAMAAEADAIEKEIVKSINPILMGKGIFLYGLDTLVDDNGHRVISEINTLSVGGITPAEKHHKHSITRNFINKLLTYCEEL